VCEASRQRRPLVRAIPRARQIAETVAGASLISDGTGKIVSASTLSQGRGLAVDDVAPPAGASIPQLLPGGAPCRRA
jgi:hypothetical protein